LVLRDGSLLVSDDKHNAIYRITYTNQWPIF
jgi:glucose/arabinose dehydrogenase